MQASRYNLVADSSLVYIVSLIATQADKYALVKTKARAVFTSRLLKEKKERRKRELARALLEQISNTE